MFFFCFFFSITLCFCYIARKSNVVSVCVCFFYLVLFFCGFHWLSQAAYTNLLAAKNFSCQSCLFFVSLCCQWLLCVYEQIESTTFYVQAHKWVFQLQTSHHRHRESETKLHLYVILGRLSIYFTNRIISSMPLAVSNEILPDLFVQCFVCCEQQQILFMDSIANANGCMYQWFMHIPRCVYMNR